MQRLTLLTLLVLFIAIGNCSNSGYFEQYDAFLQKYVSTEGRVNYKAISKNSINQIVQEMLAYVPDTKNTLDIKSHVINVYNAVTIQLVVNNKSIKSIMDLDGGKTWDVKRIKYKGEMYSLNELENNLLRKIYNDPRIHFALNCAARSCPPLYNRAFTSQNLEAQLNDRTIKYLQRYVHQNEVGNIELNKIFDWYKEDFGDLHKFINTYRPQKLSTKARIEYVEYDWRLNDL